MSVCSRRARRIGETAVAGDREEPRLELDWAIIGQKRLVRTDVSVLQGVLGLFRGAEHVPAERQEIALVAVVDDLEGRLIAGADARDEAVV